LILCHLFRLHSTPKTGHEYKHDGLTWRVILRTKKLNGRYQTRRTLTTNLPSDGYFYVNEEALKSCMDTQIVKNTGGLRPRHLENCKDEWDELEREVWDQLAVFETAVVNGGSVTIYIGLPSSVNGAI
jgi:hypothetical protein